MADSLNVIGHPEGDEVLTPELAKEVVKASFRLSQGTPGVQEYLFQIARHLRPQWVITPATTRALNSRKFFNEIKKIVNSDAHIGTREPLSDAKIKSTLEGEAINPFLEEFGKPRPERDPETLRRMLIWNFVERDLHFLKLGTEAFEGPARTTSNVVSLLFGKGEQLKVKVFADMFTDLRAFLKNLGPHDGGHHSLPEGLQRICGWYNSSRVSSERIDLQEYLSPEMYAFVGGTSNLRQ